VRAVCLAVCGVAGIVLRCLQRRVEGGVRWDMFCHELNSCYSRSDDLSIRLVSFWWLQVTAKFVNDFLELHINTDSDYKMFHAFIPSSSDSHAVSPENRYILVHCESCES
jgi:hypothetical protein